MTRPTVTRGTARELAEHDASYVASGEGEFSRRVASPGNVALRGKEPRRHWRQNKSPAELLRLAKSDAARTRGNLMLANNPVKIAALKDILQRKLSLIAKLESQR
jgi:hypothetical protein